MADGIHGNTELGATKEEMIAAVVQRELIEKSVVAQRVTDWSFLAEPGASQIEIPKGGSFTVANRAEGVAGDASVITFSTDVMPLSFNAYVAWIVDYKSKVQSRIDTQLILAARAASAHAYYLDQQIIAKLEAAGDATATAGVITYDIVLEMRKTFLDRDGILANSTLLVGTDTEAALLDIEEFKRAEVYGSAVIPSGVIGMIHGMPVVVSNKVAASSYYLFDKEAVGYGLQAGPSFSEEGANAYGSQAKRAAMDQLFGTWAGFLGQKGAGPTESALIIKDAN